MTEGSPTLFWAEAGTAPDRHPEQLENSIASVSIYSQGMKGIRWMPRRQEPMKDAAGCDKPRGAAKQAPIRGSPNGATRRA